MPHSVFLKIPLPAYCSFQEHQPSIRSRHRRDRSKIVGAIIFCRNQRVMWICHRVLLLLSSWIGKYLCELLLNLSDVFGNVVYGRVVFVIKSVTLTFSSYLVWDNSSISVESWEGHAHVVIQLIYLPLGSAIL